MPHDREPSGGYARWRWRRRLAYEAKHLLKEARRIQRKYDSTLKGNIRDKLDEATALLQKAINEEAYGELQRRADKLDRLLDRELSYARKSALREYTESIGVAVFIALLLRAFVVEAFKIPSGSMIPTLEVGDHIFVNKFIYGLRVPLTNLKPVAFGLPNRGEVVVFVYPKDESKDFIKRVVAVGGDTIAVDNNQIVLNGKPVKRKRIAGPCIYSDEEEGTPRYEPRQCVAWEEELDGTRYRVFQDPRSPPFPMAATRVPEGHVFVMGDNRDNSADSRSWGMVPETHIKGKAMIIWWSSGDPDGIRWWRFFDQVHADPAGDLGAKP